MGLWGSTNSDPRAGRPRDGAMDCGSQSAAFSMALPGVTPALLISQGQQWRTQTGSKTLKRLIERWAISAILSSTRTDLHRQC